MLGGSKDADAAEQAKKDAEPLLGKPLFSLIDVTGSTVPAVGATIPVNGKSFKVALRYKS
jgi:hypothetical protein